MHVQLLIGSGGKSSQQKRKEKPLQWWIQLTRCNEAPACLGVGEVVGGWCPAVWCDLVLLTFLPQPRLNFYRFSINSSTEKLQYHHITYWGTIYHDRESH